MEKEQLVIKPSTALALKAAGLAAPSCFSYYQSNSTPHIELTAVARDSFIAYAYTATELMDVLPGVLGIDKDTYIATTGNWVHPTKKELNYPCAHLKAIKTADHYIAAYYHLNRNIAFRQGEDGKVVNLIFIEARPAEALAQMALALLKEGKMTGFINNELSTTK